MIFLQLFWTFFKIGIFTFGGGVAMVALIQNEVTVNHNWITPQEFTDILAVSQMTPGPVGINTATYTGYTTIVNAGYDTWVAIIGSIMTSVSVILLPIVLMIVAVRFLQRYRNNRYVDYTLRVLRMAVVGVIAAAALQLVSVESFGMMGWNVQFVASVAIFLAVFVLSMRKKSPIVLMLGSGAVGLLLYGLV